jgi:two-component system chemotaxis response regulator CheY
MAKKILVVDDSAAIRQSIGFVLGQQGYEIVEAKDGAEGLKALESTGKVDLVITDVNMPVLDGISMIKKLRESGANRFTPVLVLTTESQGNKMTEGKEAGATGWIVKPFSAEKFLETVNKVIG